MKLKEVIWIVLSVGIIEFDLTALAETNLINMAEWILIDIPLLLGLWWWITKDARTETNPLGINILEENNE